jgi:hypothetical protein
MKPKYRLKADGSIELVLRPFERDQVTRLANQIKATPKHIFNAALEEINQCQ